MSRPIIQQKSSFTQNTLNLNLDRFKCVFNSTRPSRKFRDILFGRVCSAMIARYDLLYFTAQWVVCYLKFWSDFAKRCFSLGGKKNNRRATSLTFFARRKTIYLFIYFFQFSLLVYKLANNRSTVQWVGAENPNQQA